MDYDVQLRKFRKKPITDINSLPHKVNIGLDDIKRIIPNREPFLLVDKIKGIDLENELLVGERFIPSTEPVFNGHFPDFPVYPGCLEIEMIGQLGLCLYYFITNKTTVIQGNPQPLKVRATRIIGAYYLEPILPDSKVTLIVKKLEYDGFFAKIMGQASVKNKVCCVAIGEVCFL